jgi:hypothetical protein
MAERLSEDPVLEPDSGGSYDSNEDADEKAEIVEPDGSPSPGVEERR